MIIKEITGALQADVVIVGSGPGGSVLAASLAAAGRDVLLIEEGPYLDQESAPLFSYAEMQQKYRGGGITVAHGAPDVAYAEGVCVGGGSEVNSGLYHRLPEEMRLAWEKRHRLSEFSAANLSRCFDECESVLPPVNYPDQLPSASHILRTGSQALGWSSQEIPRLVEFDSDKDPQGVELSRRHSMTRSFIPRFLNAGGRLLPDTRVKRVKQKSNDGWEMSTIWQDRQALSVSANALFICAGAVHTPALLKRSGVRRNVGRTLSMQPMLKVTAEFGQDINFPGMGIASEQVKEFAPRYSFGCSISSRAHVAINLLQYAEGTQTALDKHSQLISYYVMAQGSSGGTVTPLPGFSDPLVRYRLSSDEMHNLANGVRDLTRLLLNAGAERVFTGVAEQPLVAQEGELSNMPAHLTRDSANIMTVHMMGSCPMGEDLDRAAVDSFGRVHGFKNLYVSDASILCGSPGINPQGTIMALAYRNAEHFLG